jgi:hypothetical protein
MRGKGLLITLAVGIGVALGLGLSWLWPGSELLQRDVVIRDLDDAKFFAMALREYAADHEGVYPLYLSELAPDYLGAWDYVRYSAMDSRWKAQPKYDWLYFAAGRDEKHLPLIIIASPQAVTEGRANKRVVVYGDLSPVVIPEDQYQRELRQMIDNQRKTPSRIRPPRQAPEIIQIHSAAVRSDRDGLIVPTKNPPRD